MRHRLDKRKLNRDTGARKAMLRNLVTSLFEHNRIVTTEARAKETRRIAEKIITTAKADTLHARRMVLRFITKKEIVKKLFKEIAPYYKEKAGGYVRLLKIGPRKGDGAFMTMVDLLGLGGKGQEQAENKESAA
ncbi:MAG: 50S ribosomal protein L17 [bacterium]|nr:50S ribosomal protein L17 [bacterium]